METGDMAKGYGGRGSAQLLMPVVGQVMKATGGKANPGAVNEILRKKLSG